MLMSLLSGVVCQLISHSLPLSAAYMSPLLAIVVCMFYFTHHTVCPIPILPHRFQWSPGSPWVDYWQMVYNTLCPLGGLSLVWVFPL